MSDSPRKEYPATREYILYRVNELRNRYEKIIESDDRSLDAKREIINLQAHFQLLQYDIMETCRWQTPPENKLSLILNIHDIQQELDKIKEQC